MQRDNVATREEGGEVGIGYLMRDGPIGCGIGIIGQDGGFESSKDLSRNSADLARADDADGFASEVKPDEAVEGKIMFAHPVVGAMDLSIQVSSRPTAYSATAWGEYAGTRTTAIFRDFAASSPRC